jgi:cytochrome c-type biogenesis protein CcmE
VYGRAGLTAEDGCDERQDGIPGALKGLKKQRRIQVIALAGGAFGATGLVGYAMRDGINFFRSPTQVMEDPPASGETFRIGGLVVEGSIVRGEGTEVSFAVTDTNATVPVRYTASCRTSFAEGRGWWRLGDGGRHLHRDRGAGQA